MSDGLRKGPLKNIRKRLEEDRRVKSLEKSLAAQVEGTPKPPALPARGTPAHAAMELADVMKLPAAQTAVFKMASADKLAKVIDRNLDSDDPTVQMHAMDISAKLITAVVKAQSKAPAAQVNLQVVADGVSIAGLPGQERRPPAPSSPPADPFGADSPPSSDSSGE